MRYTLYVTAQYAMQCDPGSFMSIIIIIIIVTIENQKPRIKVKLAIYALNDYTGAPGRSLLQLDLPQHY